MYLSIFIKTFRKLTFNSKLLFLILGLPLCGCLKNEDIVGERIDLYKNKMEKYLAYESKSINLSTPQYIKSLKHVDNGPTHLLQHSKFSGKLTKIWEAKLTNRGNISAPVFSEDKIFILDGKANLHSLNLNGKKNWVVNLAPSSERRQNAHHSGGVVMSNNKLFVATGYGEFFSIDVLGKIQWKKKFDSPFRSAPIYHNDKIFVTNTSDLAIALNKNGDILWTLEGATKPTLLSKGVSPAYKNNKLLLPFSAGKLTAVRSKNGSELWSISFDEGIKGEAYSVIGDFGGSPIIKSNKVYIISATGQFICLNLNTGKKYWSVPIGSNSTPIINGGSIFVLSNKGKLVRIDEQSGNIIWSRNLLQTKISSNKLFGPTLAGDFLWIAGNDKSLKKIDPSSGEVILSYDLGSKSLYRPFAVHNKLYIITKSGKILAFE